MYKKRMGSRTAKFKRNPNIFLGSQIYKVSCCDTNITLSLPRILLKKILNSALNSIKKCLKFIFRIRQQKHMQYNTCAFVGVLPTFFNGVDNG